MRLQNMAVIACALACGLVASDVMAQGRDRRGDDQWVQLGCQDVSFIGRDRDTIKVGRRDGRFKAIRLAARGNDVEMLDLKVIYANGAPDDIHVRHLLRQGEHTQALDLKGRERAIDRIDMTYRARPNFRGKATVCAEGLG
jgi:hypothetical protein